MKFGVVAVNFQMVRKVVWGAMVKFAGAAAHGSDHGARSSPAREGAGAELSPSASGEGIETLEEGSVSRRETHRARAR